MINIRVWEKVKGKRLPNTVDYACESVKAMHAWLDTNRDKLKSREYRIICISGLKGVC